MPFFATVEPLRFRCHPAVVATALFAGSALFSAPVLKAQVKGAPAQLTIEPKQIVTPVSHNLYGMMTEEINHAFEGGLYAEMVQNRTMRASWSGVEHWDLVRRGEAKAQLALDKNDGPSKALSQSLKLTVMAASAGNEAGVSNTGYWGMGVTPHTQYKGSFYAKTDAAGPVKVQLVSDTTGATLAEATVDVHAGEWSKYEYTMSTGAGVSATPTNHLVLSVAHPGTLSLQLVSLFPPTYKNRPGGFRPDLMEKMAGLHPNFLRLPGGNYLEGDTLKDWYNWKETIGPMVDRPGHQAPWTYWSDDGMGLLEMLEWCEDLHIEPILAVYAGYALHGERIKPGKDLEPFVQDAVDEVEYLTGDVNTKWGAERAKDGHPAPFPLHYIEIGNEDNFDKVEGSYDKRFAQISKGLRKAYGTKYQLIATTPVKENETDTQPDLIDDHYYKPVGEMLDFTHHYDDAPRTGPKIFVGEWATLSGTPTPNWGGALADAAFMTSMERNSDLIVMASYAPLFINVNPGAGQWYTNMIGYDASKSYGSPSYYAQCLFGAHLGDGTAKSSLTGAGERFYYSATVGSKDHVLHLKLVNASTEAQPLSIHLGGATTGSATMHSLHAATYEATNSIDHPDAIKPTSSTVKVSGGDWSHTVPAMTIEVIDVPVR